MNLLQQNSILYYADYLSLKHKSIPVTDCCKYYFIYNVPMNLAYLSNSKPFFDENDQYYQQACNEYLLIQQKFGDEGAQDFIKNIGNLAVLGCIDALLMLKQIHQHSSKIDRKTAIRKYKQWLNSQKYSHITFNENGDEERRYCTRYIAHAEYGTFSKPQVEYTNEDRANGIVETRIQDYAGTRIETQKL